MQHYQQQPYRGYPSDRRQPSSSSNSRHDLPALPPQSPPSRHQSSSSRSYREPPQQQQPNPLSLRRRSQTSFRGPTSSSSRHEREDMETRSLCQEQSMPSLRTSRSSGSSSRRPSIVNHYSEPKASSSRPHLRVVTNPVLDRMQKNGWQGVGSASSSTTDLHANSSGDYDSPGLDKRGSNDSGYAEEDAGYFGNWSKIKKAVWGGEDGQNVPPHQPTTSQGSHLWDRLLGATTPLSEVVANQVARARGDEPDDDRVGEDGETKLGRAIKQYHISKAQSASDLPDWLFTASELKARARMQSSNARQSSRHHQPQQPQQEEYRREERSYGRKGSVQDFDPYAQHHQTGRGERERERGLGHQREWSEAQSIHSTHSGSGSGSRAADKLRAMREAKRGR